MPKFIIEKDTFTGDIHFSGRITGEEFRRLHLDGFDREVLKTPGKSDSDHLLDLELIFRRLEEQKSR